MEKFGAISIRVMSGRDLEPRLRDDLQAMCNRAYQEDISSFWETFADPVHILGFLDETLVSHAAWITRGLQPEGTPILRTAYVEMVATEPAYQGRGYASAVMQKLYELIQDCELGGLSPAETSLYTRLGWEYWRGPLYIRTSAGLEASPADECAMILRLPRTPPLDLDAPLSVEWRPGEVW
jgi:aminoglycoside 2'-N-acetyltransferase I